MQAVKVFNNNAVSVIMPVPDLCAEKDGKRLPDYERRGRVYSMEFLKIFLNITKKLHFL